MTRPLKITALKPYVPAKDFALSKGFYTAMGFNASEGWGGTVDFELNGHGFRLQNYYVKQWAENFMFVIGVDEIEAWHLRAREVTADARFSKARFSPPEEVDGSQVLHVWDPSGVLLVFVG